MSSLAPPDRRRPSLGWRLGGLAVVALLLTAAVVEGSRPPSTVASPVAQALAALRGLPDVADADVRLSRPGGGPRYDALVTDGVDAEPAREPGAWLATLTVEPRSGLTTAEAVAVAERVDAVMEGVSARTPAGDLGWDVWLRDDAAVHATEVRLTGTTEPGEAVRAAQALARGDGVLRVRVSAEHADAVVVRAVQATGLASAAARHGRHLTAVVTDDGRSDVRAVFPQEALADPFVELAGAVELVPSVTRVALADQGDQLGVSLDVEVADDAATDRVDRWLRASDRALPAGRTVSYEVRAPERSSSGYVGGVEPERLREAVPVDPSEPAVADDAAAGSPVAPARPSYPDDPAAPACAGGDLEPRIAWTDAAMGSRYLLLVAANVSGRPCAVQGTPALAFRGASGTLTADVTQAPPSHGTTEAVRIVVPPGAEVSAGVEWGAMSTGATSDPATAVLVTAVPGSTAVEVPVASSGPQPDGDPTNRETELDILDGAVVEVWPWQVEHSWG
ncbi:DUF4232 domain-containing protein [Cellulomonas cellasea]|uniref:DUF4232 domain-containing protein n=1 Tax=Cellulomonas cellasea TaxID=43670 RepID=A0A7W4UEP3_9CELL|nr:DUF4232 domain-containing protein [Cellulomonas cellasea]MBB2922218.1 hypothetical protein [Cellulomonas cellasea]